MAFQKAERVQRTPKIALAGPSGSGKTLSALLIANGYLEGTGKRIAVIDTENHSAALFADRVDFDVLALEPPFSVEKYVNAIHEAELAGFGFLIVDSITHEWHYILKSVEQEQGFGGNKFTAWGKWTPKHEAFKDAIIQSHLPIICTMRAKQEYAIDKDDSGKSKITKLGMGAVQRDDTAFEFDAVLMLSMDHAAKSDKDRTSLFDGKIVQPNEETGRVIRKWFASAPAPVQHASPQATERGPESQRTATGMRSDLESGGARFGATVGDKIEDQASGLREAMTLAQIKESPSYKMAAEQLKQAADAGLPALRQYWTREKPIWQDAVTPECLEAIEALKEDFRQGLIKQGKAGGS